MVKDICFYFFSSRRRHTRCSRDWSSDVCSSDLLNDNAVDLSVLPGPVGAGCAVKVSPYNLIIRVVNQCITTAAGTARTLKRSEERRVGKECRSRWSTYHIKKNNETRCN